jgi:hypothetical protein
LTSDKAIQKPKRLTRTIPPKRGPNPQGINLLKSKKVKKEIA